MNSIGYIFFLVIYLSSTNFIGAATSDMQTEHAYGRKDFCGEEARDRFTHLNYLTKNDVDEIEKLKRSINALEARKKILDDLKNIRNDYVETIESLTSDEEEQIKNNIKIESVEKFKTLLRDAMTLNAISLLTNNSSKNIAPNIESLCENDSSNENLEICNNYNPKKLNTVTAWWKNDEIASLNKTL
jgi:hypothetical protein